MGIGKKLIEHLRSEAEKVGISEFEFVCDSAQTGHWFKKLGAEQIGSVLRVKP